MKKFKLGFIFLYVCLAAMGFLWIKANPLLHFSLFSVEALNVMLSYQLTTLIIAFLSIFVIYLLVGKQSLKFLRLNRIDGPLTSEPWLGLKPTSKDSWKTFGLTMGMMISVVTMIVIYFQVYQGKSIEIVWFPNVLMVLIFSLSNSFIEEIIFRFTFVSVVDSVKVSQFIGKSLSALTFGIVHYFGTPSGIPGVLMAAFIGWILSKSMFETKGFFWAWVIHFLQDVIILFGFYAMM